MIGMIIAIIALAAMCAYFAVQSMHWEKIANTWAKAIDLDNVKEEWSKYKELSKSEKAAVLEFGIYLINRVYTEVWGDDETGESEKITVKTSGNIAQKR